MDSKLAYLPAKDVTHLILSQKCRRAQSLASVGTGQPSSAMLPRSRTCAKLL